MEFCRDILEPYEKMFPRRKDEINKEESSVVENGKKVNKDSIMLILI